MIKLDLYIKEIFDFLHTCSVKNVFLESSVRLVYEEIHNLSDTPVWDNPYYLHLCGYYNRYDEHIYVKSVDTKELILFNRYVLRDHPKTLNKYLSRQDEFRNLILKYPSMTTYIRGTLYPAEIPADTVRVPSTIPVLTNDTGTVSIELTPYNIVFNPEIYNRYIWGYLDNPNYMELIEGLDNLTIEYINTILWPIRPDDHIVACDNLTLFNMNKSLLHVNEQVDMIAHMKKWLKMFDTRWCVGEYNYEEYYDSMRDSVMWQCLAVELLSRRYVNIRTNNVHPYHIWEYLESRGLGNYRSILSHKQELFLYKNMNYLVGNRGKMSNLKILSDYLLEGYGAEIKSKAIAQDTFSAIDNCKTTPLIISESLDTDITALQNSEDGVETIREIVRREYENKLEPNYNEETITKQSDILKNSNRTYLQTKLVELVKYDDGDLFNNLYLNFIAQSTIYKLANGRCNYNVNLRISESEVTVSYTLGECIALLLYINHLELLHTVTKTEDSVAIQNDTLNTIPNRWFIYLPYRENKLDLPEHIHAGVNNSNRPMLFPTKSLLMTSDTSRYPPQQPTDPINMAKMKLAIYDDNIPGLADDILDSHDLMRNLDGQWEFLKNQYIISRACSDFVLGNAYKTAWEALTFAGELSFDLIPGYSTYAEWVNSDTILKPILESWALRSDAQSLYSSLSYDIIKAMYPDNPIIAEFTHDSYKLMIKLLEQLSSYNIAFIARDAVNSEQHTFMHISQQWFGETTNDFGMVSVREFTEKCWNETREYGELNNVDTTIVNRSESQVYGELENIEGGGVSIVEDKWERNWVPNIEFE